MSGFGLLRPVMLECSPWGAPANRLLSHPTLPTPAGLPATVRIENTMSLSEDTKPVQSHILLVEDHPIVRVGLTQLIDQARAEARRRLADLERAIG